MTRSLLQTDRQVLDLANGLDRYPTIGLDTEFSGPLLIGLKGDKSMVNPFRATLTGVSLATDPLTSFYAPVSHRTKNISLHSFDVLMRALAGYKGVCVIHNAKAEMRAFTQGPRPAVLPERVACSQVACWLAGMKSPNKNRPYALKELCRLVDRSMATFDDTAKGLDFSQLDPSDQKTLDYACEDAEVPLLLWERAEAILEDWSLLEHFWDVEMPFVGLVRLMEDAGMGLDTDALLAIDKSFSDDAGECDDTYAFLMDGQGPEGWHHPFLASPAQLQWFFEEGHWPKALAPKKKTGYGVDADTIDAIVDATEPGSLGHEAALIKQRRNLFSGLRSKYTKKLVSMAHQHPDLRLHAGIMQTGTDTGRLAVSNPPLQQIPKRTEEGKRIRQAFVAREGYSLLSADYSQIELRYLAHLVGRGSLLEDYTHGRDNHQRTADELTELAGFPVPRSTAKNMNFGTIYSIGPKKFARQVGMSVQQAKDFLGLFKRLRPEVFDTLDRLVDAGRNRGYARTILGRRRYIPIAEATEALENLKGQGKNWNNSEEYREAWLDMGGEERKLRNTPIQGSAADLMKLAMLKFCRTADLSRAVPIMQIHDDLICEVEDGYLVEATAILKDSMESIGRDLGLKVPLVAEPSSAKRWSDL